MKKRKLTTNEVEQQYLSELIKKICGNWYVHLSIDECMLVEDIVNNDSHVTFNLKLSRKKEKHIKSSGKGIVDALFVSVVKELSDKYLSLEGLQFEEFKMNAKLPVKNNSESGSGAKIETELTISNSRGKKFYFSSSGFSMISTSIKTVLKTIEYFINAEAATLKIYKCFKDAQERNRIDLIEKYTNQLSELVKVTCYASILEKLNKTRLESVK